MNEYIEVCRSPARATPQNDPAGLRRFGTSDLKHRKPRTYSVVPPIEILAENTPVLRTNLRRLSLRVRCFSLIRLLACFRVVDEIMRADILFDIAPENLQMPITRRGFMQGAAALGAASLCSLIRGMGPSPWRERSPVESGVSARCDRLAMRPLAWNSSNFPKGFAIRPSAGPATSSPTGARPLTRTTVWQ